jgi:CYTH domain-containing protein
MPPPVDPHGSGESAPAEGHRANHPDAPAGKARKYALVERERRFLLAESPVGAPTHQVLIEDRYLRGTRLRLRRMTDLDGPGFRLTYKLTQKIPSVNGAPGLITTLYLSADEYTALLEIPADMLRKIRSSFPPLGVDVFEGPLDGLVLAEAEFDTARDEANFHLPAEAVAEVTADVRFSGGRLVTLTAVETADLLSTFGIDRRPDSAVSWRP